MNGECQATHLSKCVEFNKHKSIGKTAENLMSSARLFFDAKISALM